MEIKVYVRCNDCGEFEVIPLSGRDKVIDNDFNNRVGNARARKEWMNENYEASDFFNLPVDEFQQLMEDIVHEWEEDCLEKAVEDFDENWEETSLIVQDSDLKE